MPYSQDFSGFWLDPFGTHWLIYLLIDFYEKLSFEYSQTIESFSNFKEDKRAAREKRTNHEGRDGPSWRNIQYKNHSPQCLLNWCESNHIELADILQIKFDEFRRWKWWGLWCFLGFFSLTFCPLMQSNFTTTVLCIIRLNDANLSSTKTDS